MLVTKQFEPIKAVSDRVIQGVGIRFGSPETADNYDEWFYEKTNIGLENGHSRPFLLEHGKKEGFGLTTLGFAIYEKSEIGWEYEVKMLDTEIAEKAYSEIARKVYKSSSGSAWHTTKQTIVENTFRYDAWYLVEQSATQSPADFYNPPISIKSLMQTGELDGLIKMLYNEVLSIKNEEIQILQQLVQSVSKTQIPQDNLSSDEENTGQTEKGIELPSELLEKIDKLTKKVGNI